MELWGQFNGNGAGPSHIYAAPGTFTVGLTVTNAGGLSNSTTAVATIAPAPPVANAGGPYSGTAGVAVGFSAAKSSDPQGEALTYAWNFGDNSTGTGVSPSHTYAGPGTYTVSLTAMNASGLTGTATATVTIPNGRVLNGPTPIAGAHVYLLAANTTAMESRRYRC